MILFRIALVLLFTVEFQCLESNTVHAQRTTAPISAEDMLGNTPWYNSRDGKLVPVVVHERFDDSVNRHSRWLPQAKKVVKSKPINPTNTATTAGGGGNGIFGTDMSLGNLLGWLLLVALFVAIIGLLIYTLTKAEIDLDSKKATSKDVANGLPDAQLIERMKHLPAELRRTDVNLRSEAKRLMDAGQFDQAVILLFGHQLLMLDRAGLLRLTRGKTNGRYVRETRSAHRESGDCLRFTATAFERSYFGRHQLKRLEFESLWASNERLEKCVDALQEVAA